MADKRKLQAEIDRCMKKVTEGVDTFEDIWKKVHNAANANQKEKYEADLKKEIKKLQRLRDQIKSWLASNDIKDKQVLIDKRKLIETQMERFKVVERETKTKAYSKEGLGLQAKIDPETKEKEEIRAWLSDAIKQLNVQVDHYESELECLNSGPKKRKDKEKTGKIEDLNGHIVRHKYHVKQLELILRMLDNSTISPGEMESLKDDMEYYIEHSCDADFEENEYMYNDLDLDELDLDSPTNLASSPTDNDEEFTYSKENSVTNLVQPTSPTITNNYSNKNSVTSPRKNSVKSNSTPVSVNNIGNGSSPVAKVSSPKTNSNNSGNIITSRGNNTPSGKTVNNNPNINSDHSNEPKPSTTPPPVSGYAGVVGGGNNHTPVTPTPVQPSESSTAKSTTPIKRPPPICIPNNTDHSSIAIGTNLPNLSNLPNVNNLITSFSSLSVASSPTVTTIPNDPPVNHLPASSHAPIETFSTTVNSPVGDPVSSSVHHVTSSVHHVTTTSSISTNYSTAGLPSLPATSAPTSSIVTPSLYGKSNVSETIVDTSVSHGPLTISTSTQEQVSNSLNTLKTMAAHAVMTAGVDSNLDGAQHFTSLQSRVLFENALNSANETRSESETRTARLQPLLGVAPLGPVPLNKEKQYQLALIEPAFVHLPFASDSERVRPYLPRNPYPTSVHHHHQMPPHLDSIDFFQRLSTETLFFVFYYQEGTRAQYLAAKALKKQSWRFHTKYRMWFQRHEEPKAITDEYEQGTYIYFDYEKWAQRKKDGFTFEYRYLEDKDLP